MTKAQARRRPSAVAGILLIVQRELLSYFRNFTGWVIVALSLLAMGILFNTNAIGTTARYSSDVLSRFIYDTSGIVMVLSILISMRLISEERKQGTLPLLMSSSLSEGQIIVAKYLSGLAFIALVLAVSAYIPALVYVRGKVSVGHIFSGYLGLLLLGSAVLAIGTFASAITRSQMVAGAVGATIVMLLVLVWALARLIDGPLGDFVAALALHDKHFRPFMGGTISTRNALFYASVTVFFLYLGRHALRTRRWSA